MEEKTVTFLNENRDLVLAEVELFEYKIEKEQRGPFRGKFYLSRPERPYNKDLDELEANYKKYRFLPMFWTIICIFTAFILISVLFSIFFANKGLAGSIWWAFVIPAALALGGAVFLSFYRMRQLENFRILINNQNKEVKQKINEIKQKH